MKRDQLIDLLDHLDDAIHHLQEAFVASGDVAVLDATDSVQAVYGYWRGCLSDE